MVRSTAASMQPARRIALLLEAHTYAEEAARAEERGLVVRAIASYTQAADTAEALGAQEQADIYRAARNRAAASR